MLDRLIRSEVIELSFLVLVQVQEQPDVLHFDQYHAVDVVLGYFFRTRSELVYRFEMIPALSMFLQAFHSIAVELGVIHGLSPDTFVGQEV